MITKYHLQSPLEPVLHASGTRLVWLGAYGAIANLAFWALWTFVLPQPFESIAFRFGLAALGLSMILLGTKNATVSFQAQVFTAFSFWLQLPVFTFYMYLANAGNAVWLPTLVAMLLVYHNVTDWRIATVGTFVGLPAGWIIYILTGPYPPFPAGDKATIDAFIIAFIWGCGAVIGVSAANRQKMQLTQTLATIGIMAHELRTPLSAIGLIAHALEKISPLVQEEQLKARINDLADRTHLLTSQMNNQIDAQIVNARIENLPDNKEMIVASDLVNSVLRRYPFKSTKEKKCWQVDIQEDFAFLGTRPLFAQVITNLTKNAITALHRSNSEFLPGSLKIEVCCGDQDGSIVVTDAGSGIDPKLLRSIFEPFFSTSKNTGHGLGLAFCKRVVSSINGKLSVKSSTPGGSRFTVSVPRVITTH